MEEGWQRVVLLVTRQESDGGGCEGSRRYFRARCSQGSLRHAVFQLYKCPGPICRHRRRAEISRQQHDWRIYLGADYSGLELDRRFEEMTPCLEQTRPLRHPLEAG